MKEQNEIEIRRTRFDDIKTITEIENMSYPDPWSEKMFESELHLDFSNFFVMLYSGEIIGYVCFWDIQNEAHLTNLTVRKQFRGKGLGSKLLSYALERAVPLNDRKIFLEVRVNNLAAMRLYDKFGFKQIGIRKKYYSNRDDALVMEKTL